MKKVYTSESGALVGFLKDMLEQQQISCLAKNQYSAGGGAELPVTVLTPELWVTHDEDFERAIKLVHSTLHDESNRTPWKCPGCGEHIEKQFAGCWNCGTLRPEESEIDSG